MTFEFKAAVSQNGQIAVPADIAGQIPPDKELHVVLTWEAPVESSYQALSKSLRAGAASSPYAEAHEETVYDSLA